MSDKIVYFEKYCSHCKHASKLENEYPCCECLLHPGKCDSHVPVRHDGPFPITNHFDEFGFYQKLTIIRPFLYDTIYDTLDYGFANTHYLSTEDVTPFQGGCTSIRKGKWFGRNLDWTYDNLAEFVVHVTGKKGLRYESIGIAGSLSHLTNEFVLSAKYDEQYKLVPFQMLDGINSRGVCASMNVVPTDESSTDYIPWKDQRGSICSLMVIRFILDNFATAKEAVDYIHDHLRVYFPKASHEMGYETHYLIADPNDTYILEFKNNRPRVYRYDNLTPRWITNFHVIGTQFNDDNTVYTPETMDATHNAIVTNHIHPFGSGLERWNYIAQHIQEMSVEELLHDLTYTRAYPSSPNPADPTWYTEFVGSYILTEVMDDTILTVATPASEFEYIMERADDYYIHRSRDDGGKTWQTTHRSLYDMDNKTLYLQIQENEEVLQFFI